MGYVDAACLLTVKRFLLTIELLSPTIIFWIFLTYSSTVLTIRTLLLFAYRVAVRVCA